jgi:hypothetical protein
VFVKAEDGEHGCILLSAALEPPGTPRYGQAALPLQRVRGRAVGRVEVVRALQEAVAMAGGAGAGEFVVNVNPDPDLAGRGIATIRALADVTEGNDWLPRNAVHACGMEGSGFQAGHAASSQRAGTAATSAPS